MIVLFLVSTTSWPTRILIGDPERVAAPLAGSSRAGVAGKAAAERGDRLATGARRGGPLERLAADVGGSGRHACRSCGRLVSSPCGRYGAAARPLRVRWRYWAAGLVAVVPVALVFLAVPAFFTVVGIIVARIGAPAVGSLLMFLGWSACGATFLLGVASVASGLRSLASGGRRRACAWAAGTGARLVEAALLASVFR